MKKPSLLTIIGIVLILCLIVLATLFPRMAKKNSECTRNPFVYGAKDMDEQGLEIMCSCIPLDPRYSGFYFDKEGFIVQNYTNGLSISSNFSFNSSLLM